MVHIPNSRSLKATIKHRLKPPKLNKDSLHNLLNRYNLGSLYSLKQLSGESRSTNLLVTTDQGRWILKAYKASLDAEAISFEHSLLKLLAAREFPAPRLSPCQSGETFIKYKGRFYALFEFVDGKPFDRHVTRPSRQWTYTIATACLLARYHQTVVGFTPEGRKLDGFRSDNSTRWRDHQWLVEQISLCREHLQSRQSQDHPMLNRLEAIQYQLFDLGERLARRGAKATRLAIHGDVGPYNLLIRPDNSVMLLDYECTHLEMRVYDVISALTTFASGRNGSIDLAKARTICQAYHNISPLEQEEIRLMPDLFRYVKLSGLVWRLRDAVGRRHPVRDDWLRARLSHADWLAEHGERLVTALLQGTAQKVAL